MDYIKIGYVIFLLLVILASLYVYFSFGKGTKGTKGRKESMVTIGSDLTVAQNIPGATYTTPTPANKKTKALEGIPICSLVIALIPFENRWLSMACGAKTSW